MIDVIVIEKTIDYLIGWSLRLERVFILPHPNVKIGDRIEIQYKLLKKKIYDCAWEGIFLYHSTKLEKDILDIEIEDEIPFVKGIGLTIYQPNSDLFIWNETLGRISLSDTDRLQTFSIVEFIASPQKDLKQLDVGWITKMIKKRYSTFVFKSLKSGEARISNIKCSYTILENIETNERIFVRSTFQKEMEKNSNEIFWIVYVSTAIQYKIPFHAIFVVTNSLSTKYKKRFLYYHISNPSEVLFKKAIAEVKRIIKPITSSADISFQTEPMIETILLKRILKSDELLVLIGLEYPNLLANMYK